MASRALTSGASPPSRALAGQPEASPSPLTSVQAFNKGRSPVDQDFNEEYACVPIPEWVCVQRAVISRSLHPADVLVWLHRNVVMTQILGNWSGESGYFSVLIY